MSNIVTIGYTVEGSTDKRFLDAVIKKTFEDVALQCDSEIEVYDPIAISKDTGLGFTDQVIKVAERAYQDGINVLCIHTDADSPTDTNAYLHKINPAFAAVNNNGSEICRNVVAIVPVQMIEAWMLSDKELLKKEMSTSKSNEELEINRPPENFADPKEAIKTALRHAQIDLPKRRNRIEIVDLYQPMGQKLSIERLQTLPSFIKFRAAVEEAFRILNFLH